MSTRLQFGHTLFLHGFEAGSSVEKLKRLHFSKNGPAPAPYNEAWLQDLIMRHPSLLPIDEIEPVFNPLVPICTELPMLCGFLDNLFVTPAGDLALVECKLWRNSEARREVIAQIIDYAKEMSGWTFEMLQEAIGKAKPLDGAGESMKNGLFELVSQTAEIDEASFHDAVSRNLKRGRFLLLIVGDGIREGAHGMAEFLQQHAGFHFTLAFVELALFKAPGGYIAQPRVLARTSNIDRGIVTLNEGRIVIGPPKAGLAPGTNGGKRITITQERYFEELERQFLGISPKLNAFVDELTSYGVSADFGTDSMLLHWYQENGQKWTLANISSRGQVFLESLSWQAKNAGLLEVLKKYLATLNEIVPSAVIRQSRGGNAWGLYHNGKTVTVNDLLASGASKNGWVRAIAEFEKAVADASHDD